MRKTSIVLLAAVVVWIGFSLANECAAAELRNRSRQTFGSSLSTLSLSGRRNVRPKITRSTLFFKRYQPIYRTSGGRSLSRPPRTTIVRHHASSNRLYRKTTRLRTGYRGQKSRAARNRSAARSYR
jgi:hypothetical protein